jgi:hypothetical protein
VDLWRQTNAAFPHLFAFWFFLHVVTALKIRLPVSIRKIVPMATGRRGELFFVV